MVSTKLKKNDEVIVISGKDRGRKGKILFVHTKSGRVIVEGINKRKKYVKTNEEPKGVLVETEYPINISNVMYFCDKCKKGVRLGFQEEADKKERVCKKCGKTID